MIVQLVWRGGLIAIYQTITPDLFNGDPVDANEIFSPDPDPEVSTPLYPARPTNLREYAVKKNTL